MITEQTYRVLLQQLTRIEMAHDNAYLCDECVDRENVLDGGIVENADGYWPAMHRAACMAAGMRAEALGLDINALIGRTIY